MRGVVIALSAFCVLGVTSCSTPRSLPPLLPLPTITKVKSASKAKAAPTIHYILVWNQAETTPEIAATLEQGIEVSTNCGKTWFNFTNFPFKSGTNMCPISVDQYKACVFRAYWRNIQ